MRTGSTAAAILAGAALVLAIIAGVNGASGGLGLMLLAALGFGMLALVLHEWARRSGK